MMKRIIALLLALILTVSLLPTVALAAEGETPATDSTSVTKEAREDNLNLVKTVTKEGDNYKVTLESWATGTVTTTTETKPLDIVLLLDVSGSMVDKYSDEKIDKYVPYDYNWYGGPIFGGYDTTNSDLYGYQSTQYGVWHKLSDGTYVTVKVDVEKHKWKYIYTYSYTSNGKTTTIEKSEGANDPPKRQFYYKESADTTKLDALKTAVSAFIDNVATNSPNSNISIVKFADDSYKDTEGNDFYSNGYNYTQIVKKLTKVDTEGVAALKKAIDELKAGGATASDYGLNKAQEALKDAKQERVVILFTDGEPNYHDGFDKKVATNAVNKAKELKTATTKTTIYTVGVFKNLSEDVNLYMSSVSSNYPNASAQYNNKKDTWTVLGGGSDFGKYYMNATSPVDLLKAFETISSEVSGGELGAKAVLTDVIAPNFALVAPKGTTGVTAYTVDKTADGWSTQKTTLTNGVTVGAGGQVSVTGFDYSENCVTTTEKPNTTNDYGKKLVVEFTIHHNNYGGTQPTNAGASIKDEEGKEVIKVDDPTVPVTISKPDDVFKQANEKTYNGFGFDILSEVATKANTLADGTNNAFVDIEVKITVEGTDYIYTISKGQQSGTWKQTASPKTSPNVKDEDKNGTPEAYEYPVTITFKDAAEGSNALNSTTATAKFKIKYVEATVKANNKSKKATEPDPDFDATVEGMVNGEKAEEKLTYDIARTDAGNNTVGDHLTIKPDGSTYQNNYKVTYETGTLTITADSTEKVLTIKGKTSEVTYDGDSHTVSGYEVTYPAGTTAADFTITLKNGKTGIVTETNVKTDGDGKYMMGLTEEDFNVESSKYSNVKVSYTEDGYLKINPRPITLKSGDASKTYDGAALTKKEVTVTSGNFVSGEGLDYNVTGSRTEVGTSENTYTYTAKAGTTLTNYTITEEKGDLTVTLPDLTARPNVIVNCVNTEVPAHTEKNTSLTNADHYTVSTEATKVDGQSAYTRTITLTEAGKNHFISSEYVPEYGSHTPATNGNVTEITMTYSEVNGEWAWRASHANFLLNVECTTPTVEVDLGNYIKKTLTGTNFHENFSAEFKVDVAYSCDGDKTAVGSVTLTDAAANTPFNFDKITLKQGFYYIFTVREQKANVPGVICDTTTYEFALNVKTDGNVEFGSVVDKQFVPAGAESDQFLTINNTYTRPSETFDLNTLIKKDFSAKSDSKPIPTGEGISYTFTAQIFEADDTWQQVGEIPVYTGTATLNGAASGAAFDFGSSSNPTLASGTHRYLVKEEHGGETIDGITYDSTVYRLTITVSEDGTQPNVQIEAEPQASVLSVQSVAFDKTITFTNTYFEEKDPNKCTIDFSTLIFKVLTKTGDRSFNGAEFTASVDGWKVNQYDVMSMRVIKTHFVDLQPVTLKATFPANTTFDADGKAYRGFTGDTLTVTAGRYLFLIDEINDGQTNITYDESKYWLNLGFVENAEGEVSLAGQRVRKFVDGDTYETVLALEDSEWMVVDTSISPVYFENTIDTGKDDYYPIIIPTIINKDTGMLNKTDHFAYVIGYPDGTVHPNGQITRAEVATIFFRLLRDEVRDGAFTTSNTYSDVAYGKWYNNPISTMSALGIITGYPDGTFKPNKPITRAEFAAIAARFDETQSGKSATFSDVIGHWAAKEIGIAYYNDWIKGYPDGTFKPDQNITRAEAMTLINRVLERKPESPADLLTNMNKWTDNMDTSKWYYLDVQEATNSHGYTRKTFNYELWRQMLPDPDWSRYER